MLFRSREVVLVQKRADLARRSLWKRIYAKQPEHVAVALQQFRNKIHEPWIVLIARHGRKPHQPIQPQVIGGDLRRGKREISWFAFELVLAPLRARRNRCVVGTLDDHFVSGARDTPESAIRADQM